MNTTSIEHQTIAASIAAARARPCSAPFREALAILEKVNDDFERYAETEQWEQFDALLASLEAVRDYDRGKFTPAG